ncbi:MAG: xanthine dehydrogenase [Chloroflexi bacterium HGW-Chloroflexi-3]|nr:MAG: xanthine dehydrogenase [Chloroflexi bacterium HGW-Chloroflexi-3]
MNIFSEINKIESDGMTAVLCIVTKTQGSTPRHAGSKMIVYSDGRTVGTVGGGEIESLCITEAIHLIKNGHTQTLHYKLVNPEQGDPGVCGGEVDVYLEVVGKKQKILIIGAGHVGKQLSFLANWLGFDVFVIDDREELLSEKNLPDVSERFTNLEKLLETYSDFKAFNLFVVMTTRSLEIDVKYLPEILKLDPRYIGVIGSKKRWIRTTELLLNDGILESEIEKIFSPIGLDLKSETPEEIALSIMAEILKVKNDASGENLRYFWRKKIDVE